jgi:hypothetical protein
MQNAIWCPLYPHELEDEEIVEVRLGEADELHNARVVEAAHNLHFLENVCALLSCTVDENKDGEVGVMQAGGGGRERVERMQQHQDMPRTHGHDTARFRWGEQKEKSGMCQMGDLRAMHMIAAAVKG